MANGKAYITADKEYTNPVVLFAAYNDDEFVCVSFIYKDLDAGINEINIPDDFSVENANTVKVMVWNNLEDIVPLFEAYEKIKKLRTDTVFVKNIFFKMYMPRPIIRRGIS